MIDLGGKDLLKLYDIIVAEQQFHLESHQRRITFFMGFISTLIGINIYGLIQIISSDPSWYYFLILLTIPFLIIVISIIGKCSSSRFYRIFLEDITARAKIEQELGLTYPRKYKKNERPTCWNTEPIIPTRYLNSRSGYECKGSEIFVEDRLHSGYQKHVEDMFEIFEYVGLVFMVGMMVLVFYLFLSA